MTELALLARLVLGGVFLAAGTAKATRAGRRSFERSLRGFGVGRGVVAPVAACLPRLEIAAGALLVAGVAVRPAALVVLVLLVAFGLAMGRVLARGEEVDCGCFGAASGRPVGLPALARNAVLAALAGLAAWEGAWVAPWGTVQQSLPVVLTAAALLAGAALVAQLEKLPAP